MRAVAAHAIALEHGFQIDPAPLNANDHVGPQH
jgi:hypothetical protein